MGIGVYQVIQKTNRVESLDYLRGVMAFMVMCYHYAMFSGYNNFNFILDKFGIFAVSTFYILSGLSLSLAYHNKINSFNEMVTFYVKRVFRIFPLMWIAISLALFFTWMGDSTIPSIEKIILNYTLLFPLFDMQGYIPVGAWSIGNEMIFYLFFPAFIFLIDRNKKILMITIFIIFLFIAQYFSFYLLDESIEIGKQWRFYISHFNQIYLFIAGVLIFIFFKPHSYRNKKVLYISIVLILLIILITPYNDNIDLITNWDRIYYSLLFILLTLIMYIGIKPMNNIVGNFLKFLGEVSYSIYLLHPLVAIPTVYILEKFAISKIMAHFFVALPITLIVSYLVYKFIEKPMIKFGKTVSIRLTRRLK